jgi:Cupin domain
MSYYSLDDPSFIGHPGPVFDKIRADGASAGCRVSVTSLSRDGSADPDSGIILWVHFPPGHVAPRHYHDTARVEIIMKGSLVVDDRVLKPGDVMITPPGEWYGPLTAGPDGALTAEIGGRFADFAPVTETGDDLIESARAMNRSE